MTDRDSVLPTTRLRLVPATSAMITAELEQPDQLAEALGAELAVDWPPEHHDPDTLTFWRDALERPGAAGWWLHYAVHVRRGGGSTLVGSFGYKGPPKDGVVEIGYSVVPSWQRQGLATEACLALIESAWRRGATEVVAHTLNGLEPSIGVLRKLGFSATVCSEPGVLAFTLRRPEATKTSARPRHHSPGTRQPPPCLPRNARLAAVGTRCPPGNGCRAGPMSRAAASRAYSGHGRRAAAFLGDR